MKAVRIHAFGDASTLTYEEVPMPEPAPGEVRVRVHAAGVNPVDWKVRNGSLRQVIHQNLPIALGWDVSGVVDAVGEGVETLAVGDAVYVTDISHSGASSEYMVTRPSKLARKPLSLSHTQAAALPLAALTAWSSLFDYGELKAGQKVLIHAGAGGVGSFAVQLARWAGAEVIATGSGHNEALVRDLGADVFVNYREQRFEEVVGDVDLVFDTIGGDTQTRSVRTLKPGGRLVSVVSTPDSEALAEVKATGSYAVVRPGTERLDALTALIDNGELRVVLDSVFPLERAKEAHLKSESGRARGKIVLEVVPS